MWTKIIKYISNYQIQMAFISGLCLIAMTLVYKKVLHVEVDYLYAAAPGYIFTVYHALYKSKKVDRKKYLRPLYWNIGIILVTALLILIKFI